MSEANPSSWIYWPTADNPSAKFKYLSSEFNVSLDEVNWTRQTYSTLDWLADVGGLYGIIFKLASLAVAPMAKHTL